MYEFMFFLRLNIIVIMIPPHNYILKLIQKIYIKHGLERKRYKRKGS